MRFCRALRGVRFAADLEDRTQDTGKKPGAAVDDDFHTGSSFWGWRLKGADPQHHQTEGGQHRHQLDGAEERQYSAKPEGGADRRQRRICPVAPSPTHMAPLPGRFILPHPMREGVTRCGEKPQQNRRRKPLGAKAPKSCLLARKAERSGKKARRPPDRHRPGCTFMKRFPAGICVPAGRPARYRQDTAPR